LKQIVYTGNKVIGEGGRILYYKLALIICPLDISHRNYQPESR